MSVEQGTRMRQEPAPVRQQRQHTGWGWWDDSLTVHMQGGELLVRFDENGHIFMTGPVVYIGKITVTDYFFA